MPSSSELFAVTAIPRIAAGATSDVAGFLPRVPGGKIFVVEYVNGRANLPADQLSRFIVFCGGRQFHFSGTLVGRDVTRDEFHLSEKVMFFSNAAEGLRINMTRFPANAGEVNGAVTLSGYLIDAP